MFARIALRAAAFSLVAILTPAAGWGDIVYDIDNNFGMLNNQGTGTVTFDDDAGPDRTMTITQVTPALLGEASDSEGFANLGIQGGGNDTAFDPGEIWRFNWDVSTRLTSITFQSNGFNFFIQNSSWPTSSGSFDTSSDSQLEYQESNQRFRFFPSPTGTGEVRTFDLAQVEADSTATLEVASGSTYTFTSDGEMIVTGFSFATPTAIPEPGSAIALLGIAGLAVGRRFHRKRKQAVTSAEG